MNFTFGKELVLVLHVVCFQININIGQRLNKEEVPLLRLIVNNLGTEVKLRTFDICADAYLGGIFLQYLKVNGKLGS